LIDYYRYFGGKAALSLWCQGGKQNMTHFVVHNKLDTVGVLVTDVKAGDDLTGWIMETDETLKVKANCDIPLGHKIALKDVPANKPIIKYGFPIGNTTHKIRRGDSVHTHNLRTARWQ
jgi:(2R)-sulfolactate sulfo-lyase subunit alpha